MLRYRKKLSYITSLLVVGTIVGCHFHLMTITVRESAKQETPPTHLTTTQLTASSAPRELPLSPRATWWLRAADFFFKD